MPERSGLSPRSKRALDEIRVHVDDWPLLAHVMRQAVSRPVEVNLAPTAERQLRALRSRPLTAALRFIDA